MKYSKLMIMVATLTLSSTVFASGSNDLKIFNTLLSVGAEFEQFMSQMHLGLNSIECSYSNVTHESACNMTDIAANNGQGANLVLSGEKAAAMIGLLAEAGAPTDNGMGRFYIAASSIRCTQAVAGVSDGSEEERTNCSINSGTN